LLSSGQEFDEKFLDPKHVLKVNFMPRRKNKDFVFLPVEVVRKADGSGILKEF
jgi:hypothetical protein